MVREIKGNLTARGRKFAIVCSRFNESITRQMLTGAVDTLQRHGVKDEEIEAVWVPGAFEIPYAAMKIAKSGTRDAIICLGAVIRGDTPHFEYICGEVSKSIALISLETGTPAIYGIITADTIEQAVERSGTKAGNRGRDAAAAAIEMSNLYSELEKYGKQKKSA